MPRSTEDAPRSPRTVDNLPRHELIGLHATVSQADDAGKEGIAGTVVDETRNTLVIDTGNGERQVAKDEATFQFRLEEVEIRVDGDLLVGRPEERILKKLPRKWGYTT